MLALVVCLLTPSSPALSLEATAKAVGRALVRADWGAFRKHAAPTISFEEFWSAYDSYFTKEGLRVRTGYLGIRHDRDFVHSVSAVANRAILSTSDRKMFQTFCGTVKQSYGITQTPGPWPAIDKSIGMKRAEYLLVTGPVISDTVASNVDWIVTFIQIKGSWRAQRLVIGGH